VTDPRPEEPAPLAPTRAAAAARVAGALAWLPTPRLRRNETGLLALVTVAVLLGFVTLRSQQALDGGHDRLTLGDPTTPLIYLGAVWAVHVLFVLTGRRSDQLLLPAVAMLGGLGLLLADRLPQSLVTQQFGPYELGLADLQLLWLVIGLAVIAWLAIAVRSDNWLRLYKYSWAGAGIVLLLAVFIFGREVNGARLTLCVGPVCGQPSELLKVLLVVFLAGYLSENRGLLATQRTRVGPISLPPLPYLLPMLAMWAIALSIVIVQRDLGAALLFYSVFLAVLFVATARWSYVALGAVLFVAGSVVLYGLFPHVRLRIDVWLDPFADPLGNGYQTVRGLFAFGRGGILGTGLGAGLPAAGGGSAIPAVHTDFAFTALAEELGYLGALAIIGTYLVVIERGLRIAARSADDFRALLAAGLTLTIGIQTAIIIGGNARLIPLTGITAPYLSYGGSSILASAVAVGLLLAFSESEAAK
jgi:cell division protein FtsW (lipid II flippase)